MEDKYFYCSVEDTIKYGIVKAAIIGRIKFWCEYNQKNKVKDRFHNGEWWSGFMTPKVFAEQLGMPESTIKNNLVALTNDGILIKGKFNKKGFDKTNWYRVNNDIQQIQSSDLKDTIIVSERYNDSIGEIQSIVSERYNHSTVEGEPIPYNHSVNQNVNQSASMSVNPPVNPDWRIKELMDAIKQNISNNKLVDILISTISGCSLTSEQRNIIIENKSQLIEKVPALNEYI